MPSKFFDEAFFARPAPIVAKELLGMHLVRELDGNRIEGIIIEAEAYQGEEDLGCHARAGCTRRTVVMYGPPGRAYIYFTYGMHWMLNCVSDLEGIPAAVLIRAIHPIRGLELISKRRPGIAQKNWCNGPGKLCHALSINGDLNGANLCNAHAGLWIEEGENITHDRIETSARIGLGTTPEPWFSMPWRFYTSFNHEFS